MYRLRDLREDADLSQKKVAEKMYLHPTQYRRYESGEREIPLYLAILFADLFHVSLDYLAGRVPSTAGDDSPTIPENASEVIVLTEGQQIQRTLDDRQMKLLLSYLQLL